MGCPSLLIQLTSMRLFLMGIGWSVLCLSSDVIDGDRSYFPDQKAQNLMKRARTIKVTSNHYIHMNWVVALETSIIQVR